MRGEECLSSVDSDGCDSEDAPLGSYFICFPTALRRPLLLVAQTDVTARTLLEMAMAKITEREFDMLGQVGARLLIKCRGAGEGAKGNLRRMGEQWRFV